MKGVITQSPPSVEIDGVPHRQCGEGRKQRRAGSIECGRILPLEQFVINMGYSDGHGLICHECSDKQNARYAERVATALVPVKVYEDVPIGGGGVCRGVSLSIDGVDTPHLVVIEACKFWGLDSGAQMDRINSDPVLSAGLGVVKLTTPHGGTQPAYALRYDLVPLWLAGVETGRMKNKPRATQLAAYQRVCGQVLADYFFGTQTAPPPPSERVTTDGAMAVYDDTPVLAHIDNALAAFANVLEQRLEARANELLLPYLRTIKEITREVHIDVRGVVYVCKYPRFAWQDAEEFYAMGWDRYAIGWTTKLSVEERLREYPGKYDIACPEEVYTIKTDNSKLEALIHERRPKQGVRKVAQRRDVFWLSPEALALLVTLPNHLAYEEAKQRLMGWRIARNGAELWDAH